MPADHPTLAEQIGELRRELRQRARVYPRLIAAGRMHQIDADRQVARLEAAVATLERLAEKDRLL